jgi:hypothetical protein
VREGERSEGSEGGDRGAEVKSRMTGIPSFFYESAKRRRKMAKNGVQF